jgi:plastocyanin
VQPHGQTVAVEGRAGRAGWLLLLLLFGVLAVAGPYKMIRGEDGGDTGDGGQGAVVHMAGLTFAPDALVVERGTEVQFVNDDVAPHTVTAEDDTVDSGILKPGAAAFRLVVGQRFAYFCAIHPSMTATIEISG